MTRQYKRSNLIPALFSLVLLSCCLELTATEKDPWTPLFDGKTMTNWQGTKHFGTGNVLVKDGLLVLEKALMATSAKYIGKKPFPKENYLIEFEAMRRSGSDFFAAVTFPVGKGYCTFINGGWGGSVVGLSCIDGMDASENSASQFMEFKNNTWYKFHIAVTENSIRIFSNGKPIVTYVIGDSELSVRLEVDACKPLGISSWESEGAIKSFRYRALTPEEARKYDEDARKMETSGFQP